MVERGRGREEIDNEGKRKGVYKVVFWNVAGLKNKDKEFWKGVGYDDIE